MGESKLIYHHATLAPQGLCTTAIESRPVLQQCRDYRIHALAWMLLTLEQGAFTAKVRERLLPSGIVSEIARLSMTKWGNKENGICFFTLSLQEPL